MMIKVREVQLARDPNNLALKRSLERFKEKVVGMVYRGRSKNISLYRIIMKISQIGRRFIK